MERYVDLQEITDGKLYRENDMVRVGCNDCKGCSACCEGMDDTIILDPLDVYRLTSHRECAFDELIGSHVELHVQGGLILPSLKMDERTGKCTFLGTDGRCTVHAHRPGFCRIFPLGRYYEDGDYTYILQIHECPMPNKTKVKLKRWIDTPRLEENRAFINTWHGLQKELQARIGAAGEDVTVRNLNLLFLRVFYREPYERERDFYEQFAERMEKMNALLR